MSEIRIDDMTCSKHGKVDGWACPHCFDDLQAMYAKRDAENFVPEMEHEAENYKLKQENKRLKERLKGMRWKKDEMEKAYVEMQAEVDRLKGAGE